MLKQSSSLHPLGGWGWGYPPGMLGRVLSVTGACSRLWGIVPSWPALGHAYQHFEVMKLVYVETPPPHPPTH